jgi:hypothetical protein
VILKGLGVGAAALVGGALLGVGKRVRRDARERGVGLGGAVGSLPQTLKADAAGLREDAMAAVEDGRAAGATREREVAESIEAALKG